MASVRVDQRLSLHALNPFFPADRYKTFLLCIDLPSPSSSSFSFPPPPPSPLSHPYLIESGFWSPTRLKGLVTRHLANPSRSIYLPIRRLLQHSHLVLPRLLRLYVNLSVHLRLVFLLPFLWSMDLSIHTRFRCQHLLYAACISIRRSVHTSIRWFVPQLTKVDLPSNPGMLVCPMTRAYWSVCILVMSVCLATQPRQCVF